MIYEKIKFTNSKPINEIDPGFMYKLKNRIYSGYVFKDVIPTEFGPDGRVREVCFCYEDIDEDNPARKVLTVTYKIVDYTVKQNGKIIINDFESVIALYEFDGFEYIGMIPVSYGKNGSLRSVALIFVDYL